MNRNIIVAEITSAKRGNVNYRFVGQVHTRNSVKELALSPSNFYTEYSGSVPEIPHCEIEILAPEFDLLKKRNLHIHKEPDANDFYICYPKRIPNFSEALDFFRIWCLGSVSLIRFGVEADLNHIHTDGQPFDEFEKMMRYKYNIIITRLQVV